jgi:glutamine amidotransferase
MQLLCGWSEENDTECLGILPHQVRRFANIDQKVPHMGWNALASPSLQLFDGVPSGSRVYFVHSYFVEPCADTIATTTYGEAFSAAIRRDNFFGVQFHPEKSGTFGSKILENFLSA